MNPLCESKESSLIESLVRNLVHIYKEDCGRFSQDGPWSRKLPLRLGFWKVALPYLCALLVGWTPVLWPYRRDFVIFRGWRRS